MLGGAGPTENLCAPRSPNLTYNVMSAPLLLCRTGAMTLYSGDLTTWTGGHRHPNDTGHAEEAWNFARAPDDHVYGYVQNADRGLRIERLGAAKKASELVGVTVAWCSRRPEDGQLVIHGWYENATVFRHPTERPDGMGFKSNVISVLFRTHADRALLLTPDQRRYPIPTREKGTMGHTDILYVEETKPELAADIRKYLSNVRGDARVPAPAPGIPPDQRGWGGGESAQHLALKLYVRDNPKCLGLGLTRKGKDEYVLPSLDGVDVVFRTAKRTYAVEVKPRNCGEAEHRRGLYQCVKYRALLEFETLDEGKKLPCTPVLVTEDPLSKAHAATAATFGIVHRQIRAPERRGRRDHF